MCKNKDRTQLIVDVLNQTPAVISGGVIYMRKRKSVLVFSPDSKNFKATGLFSALGVFKTVLKYDKKANTVYLKIK